MSPPAQSTTDLLVRIVMDAKNRKCLLGFGAVVECLTAVALEVIPTVLLHGAKVSGLCIAWMTC